MLWLTQSQSEGLAKCAGKCNYYCGKSKALPRRKTFNWKILPNHGFRVILIVIKLYYVVTLFVLVLLNWIGLNPDKFHGIVLLPSIGVDPIKLCFRLNCKNICE